MARVKITEIVWEPLPHGNSVLYAVPRTSSGAGVSVAVLDLDGDAVTVYAAATGGTTLANPLTSDPDTGEIPGYLATGGTYTLEISGEGVESTSRTVFIADSLASSSGLEVDRPAIGLVVEGFEYFCEDTKRTYRAISGTWVLVGTLGGIELGRGVATTTQSTSSTSAVDVTGVTATVTVATRPISIAWGGSFFVASGAAVPATVTFYLVEDGNIIDAMNMATSVANQTTRQEMFKTTRRNPSAGSHTYKMQMLVGAATVTVTSNGGLLFPFGIEQIIEC